jgi:hypothetical protein
MPAIPVLGRLRQEKYKFKASLGYKPVLSLYEDAQPMLKQCSAKPLYIPLF